MRQAPGKPFMSACSHHRLAASVHSAARRKSPTFWHDEIVTQ
jgi:hypothetical protein